MASRAPSAAASVGGQRCRTRWRRGERILSSATSPPAGHGVLASVGSVGDAYDNALAESFVDSFKTELITDRVWRSCSQLELAVVEWVGWFNTSRLHEALDDLPPAEFEALHAAQFELSTPTHRI